jgi:metal-responsive CopG/Arc/MetJ family transcriptional regulator
MKTPKTETGLRLCQDQIEGLDSIVLRSKGRKNRSDIIREAIDRYLEQSLRSLTAESERQAA